MTPTTTGREARLEIRSEARGPHWVAWAVKPGEEKPLGSVVLVGETKGEAEDRARKWVDSRPD